MYEIRLTRQAEKDLQKVLASNLREKVKRLMATLESDPFQPPYENAQHRLVYLVEEEKKRVVILRMWTHYGD